MARDKFHPGKVEEWKRLPEEAMEIMRTRDSGTLHYEIFFNEDESEAVVFERYRDTDAAFAREVAECLEFSRGVSDAIVRTDPQLYTTKFTKVDASARS